MKTTHKPANTYRSARQLSPERRKEMAELAKRIDVEESDELKAKGREIMDRYDEMMAIIQTLRDERGRQGLSLADIGQRIERSRENVFKLETAPNPNPTLRTLFRYAEALGKKIRIELVDQA